MEINNHFLILGTAVLLLTVGLSGCNEEETIQNDIIDIEKMIKELGLSD